MNPGQQQAIDLLIAAGKLAADIARMRTEYDLMQTALERIIERGTAAEVIPDPLQYGFECRKALAACVQMAAEAIQRLKP